MTAFPMHARTNIFHPAAFFSASPKSNEKPRESLVTTSYLRKIINYFKPVSPRINNLIAEHFLQALNEDDSKLIEINVLTKNCSELSNPRYATLIKKQLNRLNAIRMSCSDDSPVVDMGSFKGKNYRRYLARIETVSDSSKWCMIEQPKNRTAAKVGKQLNLPKCELTESENDAFFSIKNSLLGKGDFGVVYLARIRGLTPQQLNDLKINPCLINKNNTEHCWIAVKESNPLQSNIVQDNFNAREKECDATHRIYQKLSNAAAPQLCIKKPQAIEGHQTISLMPILNNKKVWQKDFEQSMLHEKNSLISNQLKRQCALDLTDALRQFHQQNMIHGDLKPDNVLRTRDKDARFVWADYSKSISANKADISRQAFGFLGTDYCRAPESIASIENLTLDDFKNAETYQLGINLLRILFPDIYSQLTGDNRISANNYLQENRTYKDIHHLAVQTWQEVFNLENNKIQSLKKKLITEDTPSKDLLRIIVKMIDHVPAKRISLNDAVIELCQLNTAEEPKTQENSPMNNKVNTDAQTIDSANHSCLLISSVNKIDSPITTNSLNSPLNSPLTTFSTPESVSEDADTLNPSTSTLEEFLFSSQISASDTTDAETLPASLPSPLRSDDYQTSTISSIDPEDHEASCLQTLRTFIGNAMQTLLYCLQDSTDEV